MTKVTFSPVPTEDDQRVINTVKNAFRLALAGEDMTMERIMDLHLMTLQWLVATVVAQGVTHERLGRVLNAGADNGMELRAMVQAMTATKQ